ncbi:hypothetical protein C8R43DRAFT_1092890 [Mycena crocata]|nr:hypothetical protein C8R43DRAFT_1092890 [Mycena crocata]
MSHDGKISLLRLYMENLPHELPLAAPDDSINKLLHFSLDADWAQSIGEEMAINREIEAAMFGFGSRNDEGIFKIPTRGPAIATLAGILEFWLQKYPDASHLIRWLDNATASTAASILAHNESLPSLPPAVAPSGKSNGGKNTDRQTTLTGKNVTSEKQKRKKAKDTSVPEVKKPDTKILVGTDDPAYPPADEDTDDRSGGRKLDPLLLRISKPCYDTDKKKIVRCLASAGCHKTWAWPRGKERILKHAMSCAYLAAIDGGSMVQDAIRELAKKNPHLLDKLNDKFGLTAPAKRPRDALGPDSILPVEAPPLKRTKTVSTTFSSQKSSASAHSTEREGTGGSSQNKLLTQYQTEGRKALATRVNDALVELFVNCGIAPRIIGRDEFKHFCNTLNGNYSLVSRTSFEDALVPAYAANVRIAVLDYLRTCRYLTISSDGAKLQRKKFITIHITTIHRQSFCVDLDDIIADMKEILALMSLSSYTRDWFDVARKELGISRGLESIGDTRFGTIYWSLESISRGIPAFVSIVRNPALGIDSEDDEDVFHLKRELTRLGNVLMQIVRAIQCLESKDTTPADVYLYWLAVVAQLNDLIRKDSSAGSKSKYAETVKDLIRSIANYRFCQLIEDERASNIYFTAFVLDPDNRGATILNTPNPLEIQPVTLSFRSGQPAIKKNPPLIERIGLNLQKILQREYGDKYRTDRTVEDAKIAMREINPYIAHLTPSEGLRALRSQLKNFLDGSEPFDRKKKSTDSARDWWMKLIDRDESDVLAALAVKIFSANPVSMPDERSVSEVRSKPVTVNWRDIRETIHGKPNSGQKHAEDSETAPLTPYDPANDGLDWLNDPLPDLRSSTSSGFDLAAEFDIKQYLHILADSIATPNLDGTPNVGNLEEPKGSDGTSSKAAAHTVAPKADEWGSWA